jgi:predicted nucleotidyltransferase
MDTDKHGCCDQSESICLFAGEWKEDSFIDKLTIIAKLREHEPELRAAGVEHLVLHGSYARGTAIRGQSDGSTLFSIVCGLKTGWLIYWG